MAKWFSLIAFLVAAGAAYLLFESQGLVENLQKKGESIKLDLDTTKGVLKKTKDDLAAMTTDRDSEKTKKEAALAEAAANKTEADKANGDLKSIKDALVAAGLGTAEDLGKGIATLKETISKLTADAAAAKEQIAAANKDKEDALAKAGQLEKENNEKKLVIEGLTSDKDKLTATTTTQGKKLDKYEKSIMEKNIRGRVLAVNSGWGFAVVSIGDKQGAAANKTLVVARGGQAIGKLKISNIENNQSIADIVPNSFAHGSYVQPGDDVIYMGDEKVKFDAEPGAGTVVPPLPVH